MTNRAVGLVIGHWSLVFEEALPMPPWLSALWYDLGYWSSVAALTLGFSMRIAGRANVPRKGPVLLLANHESFIDPLAVGVCCPRRLHYLARKTLFKHRVFGAYL